MTGMVDSFNIGCTSKRRWRRLMRPAWALLLLLAASSASAQDWSYRIRLGDTCIANPYPLSPGSTIRFPLLAL